MRKPKLSWTAFLKVLRLQPWELMRNGVAAFNGVLVGTVISSLYPTVYNVEMDLKMWIFICLGAIMRWGNFITDVALLALLWRYQKAYFPRWMDVRRQREKKRESKLTSVEWVFFTTKVVRKLQSTKKRTAETLSPTSSTSCMFSFRLLFQGD